MSRLTKTELLDSLDGTTVLVRAKYIIEQMIESPNPITPATHALLNSLEEARVSVNMKSLINHLNTPSGAHTSDSLVINALLRRLDALEARVRELTPVKQELLSTTPMIGLEISYKSTQTPITVTKVPLKPEPYVKAEAEVKINLDLDVSAIDGGDAEEVLLEEEAEEEVLLEEEAEEEEEEAVELEEFEYKGATYYRDSDNNVFTTDEEGELNEEPFGLWNAAKQRIVALAAK